MKLIGLHGRAGVGKKTVTEWLRARHGFSVLPIATPIDDALVSMLELSRFDLHDPVARHAVVKRYGVSPDQLRSSLRHDWGPKFVNQDIWIARAEERLRHYRLFSSDIVLPDVEDPREAAWIRRQGGAIWHILRPLPQNVTSLHASEHGIDIHLGVDSVIQNADGLEQLRAEIARALAGECVVVAPAA